jgi:hypothetical protein
MLILLYSRGIQWHGWGTALQARRSWVWLEFFIDITFLVLVSTQPLTVPGIFSGGLRWPMHCLNLPEPSRPVQACTGVALRLPLYSHCYTATCFSPQGAIHRKYWYILWAGSTKYMSRCKYLEIKTYLHVSYTDYKNIKYNIQGVYTYNPKSLNMKIKI